MILILLKNIYHFKYVWININVYKNLSKYKKFQFDKLLSLKNDKIVNRLYNKLTNFKFGYIIINLFLYS